MFGGIVSKFNTGRVINFPAHSHRKPEDKGGGVGRSIIAVSSWANYHHPPLPPICLCHTRWRVARPHFITTALMHMTRASHSRHRQHLISAAALILLLLFSFFLVREQFFRLYSYNESCFFPTILKLLSVPVYWPHDQSLHPTCCSLFES